MSTGKQRGKECIELLGWLLILTIHTQSLCVIDIPHHWYPRPWSCSNFLEKYQVLSFGKNIGPENSWAGCWELKYIHNTCESNLPHPSPEHFFLTQTTLMSFEKDRGSFLGWLLGLEIYTYPSRTILLPQPDLVQCFSVSWEIARCRDFLDWLLEEWYTAPLSVRLVIPALVWLLWRAANLSLLPYLKT